MRVKRLKLRPVLLVAFFTFTTSLMITWAVLPYVILPAADSISGNYYGEFNGYYYRSGIKASLSEEIDIWADGSYIQTLHYPNKVYTSKELCDWSVIATWILRG